MVNLNKTVLGTELAKWDKYLDNFRDTNYFKKLKLFLKEGSRSKKFNTSIFEVFKPFDMVDPSKLKVVILTDTKHIHGGLPYGKMYNSSFDHENQEIETIKDSIELQFKEGLNMDFDDSLESWANQGVLILNSSLTHSSEGKDLYYKVWRRFNAHIVKCLVKNYTGIHYVFMGGKSIYYRKHIKSASNYVYNVSRPEKQSVVNFSAFKEINKKILEQNGEEFMINWTDYQ
jgi:uracil DNA glycosylase